MSTKTVTVTFPAATYEWLEELARVSSTTVGEVVAGIVREDQARAAMEGVAAWARDDDDAPTIEEVDRARARMLGEDDS